MTPKVLAWFRKNYHFSVALEIKSSQTNSIAKSTLLDHQLKALLQVKTDHGLSFKIPDTGHMKLPFDAFQMKNTQAFVVACFPKHGVCLAIKPEKWRGAKYDPQSDCTFVIEL